MSEQPQVQGNSLPRLSPHDAASPSSAAVISATPIVGCARCGPRQRGDGAAALEGRGPHRAAADDRVLPRSRPRGRRHSQGCEGRGLAAERHRLHLSALCPGPGTSARSSCEHAWRPPRRSPIAGRSGARNRSGSAVRRRDAHGDGHHALGGRSARDDVPPGAFAAFALVLAAVGVNRARLQLRRRVREMGSGWRSAPTGVASYAWSSPTRCGPRSWVSLSACWRRSPSGGRGKPAVWCEPERPGDLRSVSALLLVVALGASALPAYSATRVNPMLALRDVALSDAGTPRTSSARWLPASGAWIVRTTTNRWPSCVS